jgi:hypothetical protein
MRIYNPTFGIFLRQAGESGAEAGQLKVTPSPSCPTQAECAVAGHPFQA